MATATPRLIYSEDVVEHPTNQDMIGVVLQNAQSSDDELSSSEDEEQIQKGHCVVAWYPKGIEEEIEEKKLKIVDRSLIPGDVVRWVDGNKPQQKGYIKNVQVRADLRVTGTNYTINNVNCSHLTPLQELFRGLVVADGPWMGIIREVEFALVLRLKNGSRCTVHGEQENLLVDATDQRDEGSPFYCFGFYPGQHVYGPARVFKEAEWLSGTRPILGHNQRVRAIVEEASIAQLNVDWQVCGYVGDLVDESPSTPSEVVLGAHINRLKPLNHFRVATIQVGDKAFYTLSEDDVAAYCLHQSRGKAHAATATANDNQSNNVTATSKATDSGTQDSDGQAKATDSGTQDSDGQAKALLDEASGFDPQEGIGNRETAMSSSEGSGEEDDRDESRNALAPHVASRRGDSRHGPPLGPSRGHQGRRRRHVPRRKRKRQVALKVANGEKVCCEISRTKTIVSIVWQDGSTEEEVISTDVIPVLHLDELEFFPGDFVVDKRVDATHDCIGVVQTANSRERTCQVVWMPKPGATATLQEICKTETLSVYDIADHGDYNFRPGDCVVRLEGAECPKTFTSREELLQNPGVIGQVMHVTQEGKVQVIWSDGRIMVLPCHHVFVVHREDDDEGDDYSTEGSSEEDSDEWETASDSSEEPMIENQIDPLEDVIMRSLAALGTSAAQRQTNGDESSGDTTGPCASERSTNTQEAAMPSKEENSVSTTDGGSSPEIATVQHLDHFAMVENVHASHHFFRNTLTPVNPRQFASIVRRELKLLQSSLPSGIHICAYEDRLDLFSILIEGPPGTPYEGGLFAFDLQLSPDYPKSPPSVYYVSYCAGRLNPNLYEDGKVCVSLLGTWSGKGTETWTSKSNLCQVVVSLQGLILCAEPYYNEAGYEKHKGTAEGKENSRMYNEMAIIKLLQSMEAMIRNPPVAFREKVYAYMQNNLHRLIHKFRMWIKSNGPDESSTACSVPSIEYPLFPISQGFCLTLERTLERLESVIERFLPKNDDQQKRE